MRKNEAESREVRCVRNATRWDPLWFYCVEYIIRHVMEDRLATNTRSKWDPTVPKKFEIRVTHLGDDGVASMFPDKVMYWSYWSLV